MRGILIESLTLNKSGFVAIFPEKVNGLNLWLNTNNVLCDSVTAPEVVNYEPLGLEADMWWGNKAQTNV